MSKGEGRFITVKFTEDLTSVIDTSLQAYKELKTGITVSGSSTGSLANLLDNNTGTVWGHYSASNFIQIDLQADLNNIKRFIKGFKVYVGASGRPTGYTISTSNDNITYTTAKTGTIAQATGWQEFLLDAPIKTRYARVKFDYTSSFNVGEFAYLIGDKIAGFTVKGQQYKYINGPLLDKEYVIENVSEHPTIDKAVLIEFNTFGRFPTVEGNLTVEYDASVGNLAGGGGFVESFSEVFTPTDLVPEPNPGIQETVTVAPATLEVDFIPVEYVNRYAEETITVAPATLEVELIHISIINP
jgi:hypothetical protein